MLEYLKKLLQDLENLNRYIENRKQKKLALETAIEILEKIRKGE